jgi:hypothetical protein
VEVNARELVDRVVQTMLQAVQLHRRALQRQPMALVLSHMTLTLLQLPRAQLMYRQMTFTQLSESPQLHVALGLSQPQSQ